MGDNYSPPKSDADISGDSIMSNPDHNFVSYLPSLLSQTRATATNPQDAFITTPPHPLELRQNNPQDCSNLIIASVDRATVEISRTIIALNATFSQQLQQASISASNGIKSAQNSASLMVNVISQSASTATSSAFSSVTVARLAVTSANLAFTSMSSASSSEIVRLSSSLSLVQANLDSAQASASLAISAVQSTLASATAQLALASQTIQSAIAVGTITTTTGEGQSIQLVQPGGTILLTVPQAIAAIIGIMLASILLTVVTCFLVSRLKRKERDSFLSDRGTVGTPKNLPSRMSSAFRTGNGMVLRFNPPKSSNSSAPTRPMPPQPDYSPVASSFGEKALSIQTDTEEDNVRHSPPALSATRRLGSDNSSKIKRPPKPSPTPQNYKQNYQAPRDIAVPIPDLLQSPLKFSLSPRYSQYFPAQHGDLSAVGPKHEEAPTLAHFDFRFLVKKSAEERGEEPTAPRIQEASTEDSEELTQDIPEDPPEKTKEQPTVVWIKEPPPREDPGDLIKDSTGRLDENTMVTPIQELPKEDTEQLITNSAEPVKQPVVTPTRETPKEDPEELIEDSIEDSVEKPNEQPMGTLTREPPTDREDLIKDMIKFSTEEFDNQPTVSPIQELPREYPEPLIKDPDESVEQHVLTPIHEPSKEDPEEPIEDITEDSDENSIEQPMVSWVQEPPKHGPVERIEDITEYPPEKSLEDHVVAGTPSEHQINPPFETPNQNEVDISFTKEPSMLPVEEKVEWPTIESTNDQFLLQPAVALETVDSSQDERLEHSISPDTDALDNLTPQDIKVIDNEQLSQRIRSAEMEAQPSITEKPSQPPSRDVSSSRQHQQQDDESSTEGGILSSPIHQIPDNQQSAPPSPLLTNEGGEIIDFEENPPSQHLVSFVPAFYIDAHSEDSSDDLKAEDHERRGRSIIRTSDIIEARLSAMAELKMQKKERESRIVRDEGIESPPTSPGVFEAAAMSQSDRGLLPPRHDVNDLAGKKGLPLTLTSLLHPIATSSAATVLRGVSEPRRNPGELSDSHAPAAPNARITRGNAQFSKNLSKFENLAAQNRQDTIKAASEVTSRAIAGIYIPGSLREQAVRNVSKSRERGQSRVR